MPRHLPIGCIYGTIGCKVSPVCICGFNTETIKHFLRCPIFAAQRHKLLSSAVQMFADDWSRMNDAQIVQIFLHGSSSLLEYEN